MEYFIFWFYAGLAKLAWVVIIIALIYLGALICMAPGWVKRKLCKHESFRENRACHGICNKCSKDLGFVGNLDRRNQSN